MSQRKIVIEPDPILRKKSESLEKVDDELRVLLDDMLETMYAAPGIGLAAVQVGILKRIIVIDISKDKEKKNPIFLINPEIISRSKKTFLKLPSGKLSSHSYIFSLPLALSYACPIADFIFFLILLFLQDI